MQADERDFLTASEIAAEISATHDVHVDCALAAVKWLAGWLGKDPDQLIRMNPPTCMNVRRHSASEPAPSVVNVHMQGAVMSERELAETIQRHLRRPPGSMPVGR